VDHFKRSRIKAHIDGDVHKKKLELFLKGKTKFQHQPSVLSSWAKAAQTSGVEKSNEVILDKAKQEFRVRVILQCLEAGIDTAKIAKTSSLLSTPQFSMPESASSISSYIPLARERLHQENQILQDRYFCPFNSCSIG
jgi:hypothetical protein